MQEYLDARAKTQYIPSYFSFAFAGTVGGRRASLINIFFGLRNPDLNSAPPGLIETNLKIK